MKRKTHSTLICVIFLGLLLTGSQANTPGNIQDQYSPIVEWQQLPSGEGVKPIHIILLPSGNLFFLEPYFLMAPSLYNVVPPV